MRVNHRGGRVIRVELLTGLRKMRFKITKGLVSFIAVF